jgi:Tol biopolymer transport system component
MVKIIIPFFLVGLTTLVACGVSGSKGGDKQNKPAISGKIVFAANDTAGISQIYVMKANGTDIKQLTHEDSGGANQPSWSPDGKKIIYSSFTNSQSIEHPGLKVMNTDGSNKHALAKFKSSDGTSFPLWGRHARWSPDGNKIAFDICLNCQIHVNIEIFTYNFKTDSVTQITHTNYPVTNQYPTWSPGSKKIAFATDRDYINADSARYRQDLYVINADGTHLQRLTHSGKATRPKWGPDGNKIAYEWNIHGNTVYIYYKNSGKIRKLNTGLAFSGVIGWNANGEELLVGGRKTKNSQPELRLINYKKNPSDVLRTLKLNKKPTATDEDWYNN